MAACRAGDGWPTGVDCPRAYKHAKYTRLGGAVSYTYLPQVLNV